MNKHLFISGLITLGFCLPSVSAQQNGKQQVIPRKRPTHAEISKKQEEQAKNKPKTEAVAKKPIVTIKKRTLIGRSTLLAHGGHWTLVPKGALIHIPKHLVGKVVPKPQGTLIEWNKFLRNNYGWLHVHPVTMKQAQGKEKLVPEQIKAYQSMGKIVVATCAGGPISVAPDALKVETKE